MTRSPESVGTIAEPKPEPEACHVFEVPDAVQSVIVEGNPGAARGDPDWPQLVVANQILGGSASSRLFTVLRERKGLTYGIYSSLDGRRRAGDWSLSEAKPDGDGRYSISKDGKMYAFELVDANLATIPQLLAFYDVTLMNPKVLGGLFIGVMLVFVFCAMTMNAVGRAAYSMIDECRRQFAIMKKAFKAQGLSDEDIANPLKWPYRVEAEGHEYPDYASCVAISTAGAQKEMVVPSLMAVAVPIVVGLILGVAGVMGLLAGALVCGFAVAIFMANAGGAWDNAKKYIETGKFGGKGSDAHKAGVVGDTVGDPFKDTSVPALNILIKLVSVVSVVFAGLIVKVGPYISDIFGL